MPLAGGESGYGAEFFDSLLDGGAVSIVMPDIKHCGGAVEAVSIGRSARAAGQGVLDAQSVGAGISAGERTRHRRPARLAAAGTRRL